MQSIQLVSGGRSSLQFLLYICSVRKLENFWIKRIELMLKNPKRFNETGHSNMNKMQNFNSRDMYWNILTVNAVPGVLKVSLYWEYFVLMQYIIMHSWFGSISQIQRTKVFKKIYSRFQLVEYVQFLEILIIGLLTAGFTIFRELVNIY